MGVVEQTIEATTRRELLSAAGGVSLGALALS